MRPRPAHISRDTTRRRTAAARPPAAEKKARETRASKPRNLTNLTPYQLWGGVTPQLAAFLITGSRGQASTRALLGDDFQGVCVSDR
jgi:hypothetical protein